MATSMENVSTKASTSIPVGSPPPCLPKQEQSPRAASSSPPPKITTLPPTSSPPKTPLHTYSYQRKLLASPQTPSNVSNTPQAHNTFKDTHDGEGIPKGGFLTALVIGVTAGALLFLVMIIFCVISTRKRNKKLKEYQSAIERKIKRGEISSDFTGLVGLPKKTIFTYEELATATDGFSQANFLGEGGFGSVHKGTLPDGTVVAVKSLKSGSSQGKREFRTEIEVISRVHHRHLVSLVGYCIDSEKKMLVYPFVSNGTVHQHLHENNGENLDWSKRRAIAIGSAKGLAYLHQDCHPRIIHRDIKASNILLDDDYKAMVSDFGLAKLTEEATSDVSTRLMGTLGYLAPEYYKTGKVTDKSDVFSFGVMLLELITGRLPMGAMEDNLVNWARPIVKQALDDGRYDVLVDSRLGRQYDRIEMTRFIACADACIKIGVNTRPRMDQIARVLEGVGGMEELNNALLDHILGR